MTRSVAIACFVKTPGLSPIKTRLQAVIGERDAQAFYVMSCLAVRSVLKGAVESLGVSAYWAVAERGAEAAWRDFPTVAQGEGELGARLSHVYETLRSKHDTVMLIGADAPQISLCDITSASEALSSGAAFSLGLARDGGFYLFAGRAAVDRKTWDSVPYSAPETGAEMREALSKIGAVNTLDLRTDVDVAEDLQALSGELAELSAPTDAQRALLKWLEVRRATMAQ